MPTICYLYVGQVWKDGDGNRIVISSVDYAKERFTFIKSDRPIKHLPGGDFNLICILHVYKVVARYNTWQEAVGSKEFKAISNVNLVVKNFNMCDRKAIDFLDNNKDLWFLIADASIKIREIFPKDTKLCLEYVSNEEEDGNPQLVLAMNSKKEPYLLDYLDKFTYDFWLDNLDLAQGRVVFTV